jgi:uncharacterized protein YjbI with pentapeptide repeats
MNNRIKIYDGGRNVVFNGNDGVDNTLRDILIDSAKNNGMALRFATLNDISLSEKNITISSVFSNICDSKFKDCIFLASKFISSDLSNCFFNSVNACESKFSKCKMNNAIFEQCHLQNIDFSNSDLEEVYFLGSDLTDVKFCDSHMKSAIFLQCDLEDANFTGADITDVIFNECNFTGVKGLNDRPMVCPEKGEFIGWKKIFYGHGKYTDVCIIKLQIPADAKRSSGTSRMCRCDKAKTLEIKIQETGEKIEEIHNESFGNTLYKVGETTYADEFDENRWVTITHGLHFFMTEEEAINY